MRKRDVGEGASTGISFCEGGPLCSVNDTRKSREGAAYPVCVVSRRGPRGEPWLQQVQVFLFFIYAILV